MKRFFDPSPPLLTPFDIISALTGKKKGDLLLPSRAIITFSLGDLKYILNRSKGRLIEGWSRFRQIYHIETPRCKQRGIIPIEGQETVVTRSHFGGPNIAALVEELAAFGVKEFILWGYCGSIDRNLAIGDIIISRGALREDGVSYHYLDDNNDFIYSDWFDSWADLARGRGFNPGTIWSCDAIYRETKAKIARHRNMGISGVEMEVASFYSVCKFKGVKGIAFLVVSDLFHDEGWTGGFRTREFKDGVKKLAAFILEEGIN
ncbi:MAG: hypothetical protein C0392_16040 [Syntrophus sp. (in: bacteria)]|nr:hypothetical protein [Syntrophus sp. (in: bacteria)]